LSAKDVESGVGILDVLVNGGLCKSKSEARKIIEGNGLLLNGLKVTDVQFKIVAEHFKADTGEALIRKGKKDFLVLRKS
jgi:tyrosyl-tRNA synthetase